MEKKDFFVVKCRTPKGSEYWISCLYDSSDLCHHLAHIISTGCSIIGIKLITLD